MQLSCDVAATSSTIRPSYVRHMRADRSLTLLSLGAVACGGKVASTNEAPGEKYRGAIKATNNDTCTIGLAFWRDEPADDATGGCASWGGTEYGDCCYSELAVSTGLPDFLPPPASAGAVSFALPAGLARLVPDDENSYPPERDVPCNQPGTLEVSAAGDEVHAFTGHLPIVTPHTFTSAPSDAAIDRDRDFVLRWIADPRPGMTAVIALQGEDTRGGPIPSATCRVAEAGGTVTFPAALLKGFPAGSAALVVARRSSTTTVTPDNAEIDLTGAAMTVVYVRF
jgi:hypothetical protein